jgi:hypothetical protein
MYQVSPTVDNVDHVSDASVTPAGFEELPGYAEWCDDVARANAAAEEAELELLAAQAEREMAAELAASPFGDLTAERYEQLIATLPSIGWGPTTVYHAGASRPFEAQLRRGTPAGPDIAFLGYFISAEAALQTEVAFANEMVLADASGDAAWCDRIRARITYARPLTIKIA